jgi:hypothetical protein
MTIASTPIKPRPRPVETFTERAEIQQGREVVDREKPVLLQARIPRHVLARIDQNASREGISRNAFLVSGIMRLMDILERDRREGN